MPWKQEPSSGSSTSSGTVGTSSTTGPTSTKTAAGGPTKAVPPSKRQRKRSSTVSSLEQPSSKAARKKLGYTDRSSAISSYTLLLQASQIERQRSKRLVEGFTKFQGNSSELFWSEVESKVGTIVTAKKAGTITRAAGLKQGADDFGTYLGLVAPPVPKSSPASSSPSLNVIGA
ncbi:hypothetical protein BGZ50_000242, partial [Haplosporangium sp. Z 11]